MELDEFGREVPHCGDLRSPFLERQPYAHHGRHGPELAHRSQPIDDGDFYDRRAVFLDDDRPPPKKIPRGPVFKDAAESGRGRFGRDRSWKQREANQFTFTNAPEPLLCERLWSEQLRIKQEQGAKLQKRESSAEDITPSYQQYVHNYCQKYAQAFFKNHFHDSWLRKLYSPLEFSRSHHKLIELAKNEAFSMIQEVKELGPSFLSHARLDYGVKGSVVSGSLSTTTDTKSPLSSLVSKSTLISSDRSNHIPYTHVHHVLKKSAVLRIIQVPPHVSDSQLLQALNALSNHMDALEIVSSPVLGGIYGLAAQKDPWWSGLTITNGVSMSTSVSDEITTYNNTALLAAMKMNGYATSFLSRTCWVIFPSHDEKEKLLQNLSKVNDELERADDRFSNNHPDNYLSSNRSTMTLTVECSDPYGRLQLDVDGKGTDDTTTMDPRTLGDGDVSSITPRKATVLVCTDNQSVSISVLSASISSSTRIRKDKQTALSIARALDIGRNIPPGSRIDDLINLILELKSALLPDIDQDILDVTIAYLRRVHLLSYYNCCKLSDNFGSALESKIFIRLKGADKILENVTLENKNGSRHVENVNTNGMADSTLTDGDEYTNNNGTALCHEGNDGGKAYPRIDYPQNADMLVRLLDRGISKALDCCANLNATETYRDSSVETLEAAAHEIEKGEEEKRIQWVNDHCLLDNDGRARCMFNFCKKLFKDKLFLEKHLMKKHCEYLDAELAKCHESSVEKFWGKSNHRPLPPVVVDCGPNFGLRPCVIGQSTEKYFVVDPEPELLRLAIQEEESSRREFHSRYENDRKSRQKHLDPSSQDNLNVSNKSSNFIDVDDMKDEKVKLSFDNVDVLVVANSTTHGKKKKKLL